MIPDVPIRNSAVLQLAGESKALGKPLLRMALQQDKKNDEVNILTFLTKQSFLILCLQDIDPATRLIKMKFLKRKTAIAPKWL